MVESAPPPSSHPAGSGRRLDGRRFDKEAQCHRARAGAVLELYVSGVPALCREPVLLAQLDRSPVRGEDEVAEFLVLGVKLPIRPPRIFSKRMQANDVELRYAWVLRAVVVVTTTCGIY